MDGLLYREEQSVAVLTLNRPGVKNAIDGDLMDSLARRVDELAARDDILSVLLTGAGEAFCAGGDLRWLQRYDTGEGGEAMSRRMQGTLMALSDLPMPVIGVLNGHAYGGGAEIALACDMRIMEAHAHLCFKQVQVGIMTGWTGGARLLGLVGYPRALELTLTCPKIDATRALELGLANSVAPSGDGITEAMAMVEHIRRGAPRSVRAMKTLLRAARHTDIAGAAEVEAALFRTLWASDDHQEGLNAFFEKRKPDYGGR